MSDKYDEKLDEAAYFLDWMRDEERGPDHRPFSWNLGAFLSAARCVPEYIRKAAAQGGAARLRAYDELVVKEPLMKLFRDLRNSNIHEAPVKPPVLFTISGFVPDVATDSDGRSQAPVITDAGMKFWFDEWQGPEAGEVLDACDRYLVALRKLLDDAVSAGIITR
jgi:hypothetical protein